MTAVSASTQFELLGYNHVALVCSDMQNTVDFLRRRAWLPAGQDP